MPLRLAKYGVPLSETADAGLEAAGIEIGAPVRQLEVARVEPIEPDATAASIRKAAGGAAEAIPAAAARPPGAEQALEAATEHTREQDYDPAFEEQQSAYDQERLYEQQMYEQQPSYEEQWQGTHDSPWFAAPQPQAHPQQRQQQPQARRPYDPEGGQQQYPQEEFREQSQQPQLMVPNGPYRQRPLRNPESNGAANGSNGANGFNGVTPVNGTNSVNGANGANGVNGTNGFDAPAVQEFREPPYTAPQYQQANLNGADVQLPAQGGDSEAETYPVGGLNLPDGIPPSEAYFGAYRNHVLNTGERLNTARQLARILENEFGGTAPEQRELTRAVRELRTRFQSEQETEPIP